MCLCVCAEQCELLPSQTFLSDKHMFSCRTVRGQSSTGANLIAETHSGMQLFLKSLCMFVR